MPGGKRAKSPAPLETPTMVARRLRAIAAGLILVGWVGAAHAQRGTYIGPGSTVQGDGLRGLGIFYDGAGRFELNSAQARSIDADTMMRWNQYVYESLKEHNRL